MKPNVISCCRSGTILLLAVLLSACATSPAKRPDPADRAQERWALQLAGDYAAAYDYLSPGFRTSVSSIQYQRSLLMRKVGIRNAEYISSDCLEDSCKLKFLLNYVVVAPVPGLKRYDSKTITVENWIWTDGNWWLVPE